MTQVDFDLTQNARTFKGKPGDKKHVSFKEASPEAYKIKGIVSDEEASSKKKKKGKKEEDMG